MMGHDMIILNMILLFECHERYDLIIITVGECLGLLFLRTYLAYLRFVPKICIICERIETSSNFHFIEFKRGSPLH